MKALRATVYGAAALIWCGGCLQSSPERNPFLTLTETLGIGPITDDDDDGGGGGGGGGGVGADGQFRREMTVTLANNSVDGDLNVSYVAWVNPSSIRSAEQQDSLLSAGYVQLTREVRIGTVFTLVPGTFVFNGPGVAGSTFVRIPAAGAAAETEEVTLITPDAFLAFTQPPASCDAVAFYFTEGDEPLSSSRPDQGLFGGSTTSGGLKTLAQIDAYQCEPLKPGLFIKLGGGAKQPNEYFEGDDIRFDFISDTAPNMDACVVTITEN